MSKDIRKGSEGPIVNTSQTAQKQILFKVNTKNATDLSSFPSTGLAGSGSLFKVLQPFKPFTDAPVTEACKNKMFKI